MQVTHSPLHLVPKQTLQPSALCTDSPHLNFGALRSWWSWCTGGTEVMGVMNTQVGCVWGCREVSGSAEWWLNHHSPCKVRFKSLVLGEAFLIPLCSNCPASALPCLPHLLYPVPSPDYRLLRDRAGPHPLGSQHCPKPCHARSRPRGLFAGRNEE